MAKAPGKNSGIPFELLVQEVFQEILDQKQAKTIKVEHDVQVQGITTSHQIDVLWQFEVGGISYTTIVQARDWASKIKQEAVLAFHAVLEDIPNQPRGILVTRTGFQSGASALARKLGIKLYLLRLGGFHLVLTDISYANITVDLVQRVLHVVAYHPRIVRLHFHSPSAKRGFASDLTARPRDMHLTDGNRKKIGTMRDVIASCVDEMRRDGQLVASFSRDFPSGTALRVRRLRAKLAVSKVDIDLQIDVKTEPPIPFLTGIVQSVLLDLDTGETHSHSRPALQ